MSQEGMSAWQAQRELAWRDRVARQAASGQSIAAFCRSEGISEGTFYGWRARFRGPRPAAAPEERAPRLPAAFIDMGTVNGLDASTSATTADDMPSHDCGKIEVRIDLGRGVILQIVRQ